MSDEITFLDAARSVDGITIPDLAVFTENGSNSELLRFFEKANNPNVYVNVDYYPTHPDAARLKMGAWDYNYAFLDRDDRVIGARNRTLDNVLVANQKFAAMAKQHTTLYRARDAQFADAEEIDFSKTQTVFYEEPMVRSKVFVRPGPDGEFRFIFKDFTYSHESALMGASITIPSIELTMSQLNEYCDDPDKIFHYSNIKDIFSMVDTNVEKLYRAIGEENVELSLTYDEGDERLYLTRAMPYKPRSMVLGSDVNAGSGLEITNCSTRDEFPENFELPIYVVDESAGILMSPRFGYIEPTQEHFDHIENIRQELTEFALTHEHYGLFFYKESGSREVILGHPAYCSSTPFGSPLYGQLSGAADVVVSRWFNKLNLGSRSLVPGQLSLSAPGNNEVDPLDEFYYDRMPETGDRMAFSKTEKGYRIEKLD